MTPDDDAIAAPIDAAVAESDFTNVPVPDFTEVTAATIEASGVPAADRVPDPTWDATEYE